jgi:hypothetical protein
MQYQVPSVMDVKKKITKREREREPGGEFVYVAQSV